MTDSDQSSTTNPGIILKAAREELSYTIDSIAHELHLRSSVVKAMEDEDYDTFSSDVFLKGYFRSYCRLVRLHEERMVELLEKQLSKRKQVIDENAVKLKKTHQSKARRKALVVFSLVGLISSLGFYVFFLFSTEQPIKGALAHDANVEVPHAHQTEVIRDTTDIKSANLKTKVTVSKKSIAIEASTLVDEDQTKEQNISVKKTTKPLLAIPEKQSTRKLENPKPLLGDQDNLAETGASKIDVSVSFTGDCWFKLSDGTGKNIFGALKKAGDSLIYTGISPFTIILGDATKVEIISQGKAVNLKPFTARNGRAVITLSNDLSNDLSNELSNKLPNE